MNNVIQKVVQKEICCSCGVCVGVCPTDALSMEIQRNGDLAPCLDESRCVDSCHLCLDICPFAEGVHNPRRMNIEIYRDQPNAKFVEDIGWHTHSIVGFRRDEELRRSSASGGLATWCLETFLREGLVTRVAIVRLAEHRGKGFFEFSSASTVDEIRRSSGSVYHPVEISGIIKAIKANREERWAIVGVPCLCTAIRSMDGLRKQVPFVLGLACGMYQNTFYTEMLLDKGAVDRKRIVRIEYRRKLDAGPPSDYQFRGTDNRGNGKEIPYQGLPYFFGKNAYFRQNACNYCMDVFAETADACFMDAWLPDYSLDPRGTSLVVIRNKEIDKLFQQGLSKGEIWIDNISTEKVIASQQAHVRRKRELIYMRRGMREPDDKRQAKSTAMEKITWLLQRRAQNRSKRAWVKYGRKYGRFGFWLAVTDLLFLQCIADAACKMTGLPNRLIGKSRDILSQMKSKG